MPPGITVARASWAATRPIATRSNSPATEYTSDTPSISAIAFAASGISSISHWISTTAWTDNVTSAPLQDDGEPLPARDAERSETERPAELPHLVAEAEDQAGPAHPDRVTERDPTAPDVQAVAVELELAPAGGDPRTGGP